MMSTQPIDWYRTPVDKEVLRRFTRKSDLKGLLQAGSFLLVYAATTAAGFYFFRQRQWLPMVVVCYLHAVFFNFLSMAAAVHELSHGTVFRSRALNELFYYLFSFLTWNNPVHFRASHLLHHQLTVHRGRDKEVIQGPVAERLNWVNYLCWFTFDALAFVKFMATNLRHAAGKWEADFFFWDPLLTPDDPRRRAMCAWARVALVAHLLLLGVFIYFRLWVLIYLVSFGSFFASFLAKFCGALQHTGLGQSAPDWRLVCHTVRFGPLLRYLYWNMNLHATHHMYAAVPCYNLPRFHEEVRHDLAVAQPGFLAAMGLLLRIKRKQREDPEYIHVPEFPATAAPPRWK